MSRVPTYAITCTRYRYIFIYPSCCCRPDDCCWKCRLPRSRFCRFAQRLKGDYSENGVPLSSMFTEKTYWRPLSINVCLICIQQFSGLFSLSSQLQCLYETLPVVSEKIPAAIVTISLQVRYKHRSHNGYCFV